MTTGFLQDGSKLRSITQVTYKKKTERKRWDYPPTYYMHMELKMHVSQEVFSPKCCLCNSSSLNSGHPSGNRAHFRRHSGWGSSSTEAGCTLMQLARSIL